MDGKLLSGIRYARNRALHQFAEIVKMVRGAALPIALAAPLWEFEWRLVSELPPPDSTHNNKSQKAGEAVYKDKLAGTPARFALDAVARWFDRVVCVDAKATT